MKEYKFVATIEHTIKANSLTQGLDLLQEKLKAVPFKVSNVTFNNEGEDNG